MKRFDGKFDAENVYGIGDTHSLAFDGILEKYELKDFILIHVGDCGMGYEFPSRDYDALTKLHDYCEENNGHILLLRGNHDRPECWTNTYFTEAFDRIVFVKDYTRFKINGKNVFFVGGATSIDRTMNVPHITYFYGEEFLLVDDYKFIDPCDILVTHTNGRHQPPYGFDNIKWYLKRDPYLERDLIEEGKNMELLVKHMNPKLHIWGHFHNSLDTIVDGAHWRCLDIDEVWGMTHKFNE